MKKLLWLVCVLGLLSVSAGAQAAFGVRIDAAHFPDAGFRDFLRESDYNDGDDYLSSWEISGFTSVNCFSCGIESLEGIEILQNVTELVCFDNELTRIDLSATPNLEFLFCSGNPLTSLDLSCTPRLKRLYCSDCGLGSLDVSRNPYLEELELTDNAPGFTLYVAPDSYALSYAAENGIRYIVIDPSYSGYTVMDGVAVIVKNGMVDRSATGLIQDAAHPDDWYFCVEGGVLTDVTRLVEYDGEWFYVDHGRLDTTMSGLVEYNGGLFFVAAGRLLREVNGLIQDPHSSGWYYCANGQVQTQYTGLAQYDGAWFYVVSGRLAEGFVGFVPYNGAQFYVVNGQVAGSFTGFVPDNGVVYYVVNGQMASYFTGHVVYNGTLYFVNNGQVTGDSSEYDRMISTLLDELYR